MSAARHCLSLRILKWIASPRNTGSVNPNLWNHRSVSPKGDRGAERPCRISLGADFLEKSDGLDAKPSFSPFVYRERQYIDRTFVLIDLFSDASEDVVVTAKTEALVLQSRVALLESWIHLDRPDNGNGQTRFTVSTKRLPVSVQ